MKGRYVIIGSVILIVLVIVGVSFVRQKIQKPLMYGKTQKEQPVKVLTKDENGDYGLVVNSPESFDDFKQQIKEQLK